MTDLGSVAKGFTGDRLMELFAKKGISSALVNLGGNVQALGAKPDGGAWKVAIASPKGDGSYAGVVSVKDKAVITSGAYERYFEENGRIYHHIIDTSTGYPADSGFLSVTVIGKEGTLCDGLSTSLFAMGPEKAFELWNNSDDFDAVFIAEDGRIYVTEGVKDDFSPLGEYAGVVPEVLYHD
jgi:thiamine biosynthesis lipoprotein